MLNLYLTPRQIKEREERLQRDKERREDEEKREILDEIPLYQQIPDEIKEREDIIEQLPEFPDLHVTGMDIDIEGPPQRPSSAHTSIEIPRV